MVLICFILLLCFWSAAVHASALELPIRSLDQELLPPRVVMWTAEDSSELGRRLYLCLNCSFGAGEAVLILTIWWFLHVPVHPYHYHEVQIWSLPIPPNQLQSFLSFLKKILILQNFNCVYLFFFLWLWTFFFVIRCLSLVTIHVCQFKLQSSYRLLGHVLYICCGFWTMEFHWLTI